MSRAESSVAKRAPGAQPGNSNALKHGSYRRRRALKGVDWTTQIDRRSKLYLELRERAERIVAGAGGPAAIAPNRLALAPHAAQVELELECFNQAIRDMGPIDRRRNSARRLVEDRNRLLRTYRELLADIGWDREAPKGLTLEDIKAQYARGERGAGARTGRQNSEGMGTPRRKENLGRWPAKIPAQLSKPDLESVEAGTSDESPEGEGP